MFGQIEEAVYGFSEKIVKARYDDFAKVVLYTVCSTEPWKVMKIHRRKRPISIFMVKVPKAPIISRIDRF